MPATPRKTSMGRFCPHGESPFRRIANHVSAIEIRPRATTSSWAGIDGTNLTAAWTNAKQTPAMIIKRTAWFSLGLNRVFKSNLECLSAARCSSCFMQRFLHCSARHSLQILPRSYHEIAFTFPCIFSPDDVASSCSSGCAPSKGLGSGLSDRRGGQRV